MGSVEIGSILGDRYELQEPLNAGATATVWIAHDEFLGRRVAVKVLHDHLRTDNDLVARFADEARTAAGVTHPNLVAVFDTIATPPAIVMEWVEGPDLRRRLTEGPLPPDEVVHVGIAVCEGLDALHRQGLVHRDVKPANVLLDGDGRPKLADFGIATTNAGDRTATGVVLGTAKYLAPEQVRGAALDGRTDVFALACVLYECLTGRPPWQRDGDLPTALARLEEDPPPIPTKTGVPPALAAAILRGLARDPDRRWASAAEFAAALRAVAAGEDPATTTALRPSVRAHSSLPPPARTHPPPPLRPRPATTTAPRRVRLRRRRWPRVVGAAVVVAIALLGTTLIAGPGGDDGDPAPPTGPLLGIAAASTFDPEGTGTPGEHDELVGNAIDGDHATGWPTERYDQRDLGAKSGVGLVLRLARSSPVREVTVYTTGAADWAAEIRVATMTPDEITAATTPDDFGPIVGAGTGLAETAVLPVAATGDTVLVWITDLGAGPLPIRLLVDDVEVR